MTTTNSDKVSRPQSRGTNRRGLPTWDGAELQLYRRSLGVAQTEVAVRLAMFAPNVSYLFESSRAPIAMRSDKVEKYLAACERAAEAKAQDAGDAQRELAALRKAKGYGA